MPTHDGVRASPSARYRECDKAHTERDDGSHPNASCLSSQNARLEGSLICSTAAVFLCLPSHGCGEYGGSDLSTDSGVDTGRQCLQERFPIPSKHGPFLQDLREKVARAGLRDRILFLPEVPVEEMPRWYQALDLFVAPQRWEGFGLTPLEVMACGVPVIATTVGAFDELVMEGETGRLIPPGDAGRMRAAVDAALASPATLQQWSAAARRHVEERFRIEDEAAALNALYRELLDGGEDGPK